MRQAREKYQIVISALQRIRIKSDVSGVHLDWIGRKGLSKEI